MTKEEHLEEIRNMLEIVKTAFSEVSAFAEDDPTLFVRFNGRYRVKCAMELYEALVQTYEDAAKDGVDILDMDHAFMVWGE